MINFLGEVDKVKLALVAIVIIIVISFGLHYFNLKSSLATTRDSLAVSLNNNLHLQQKYDQLVVDHNVEVDRFKSTINTQNDEILKFKQDVATTEALADRAVVEYKHRIDVLQGDVSAYRKKLAQRPPLDNTCPSGFDFIFTEVKENSSW